MSKKRLNPSDYKKGDLIFLGGSKKVTHYFEVVESGKNKDLVFQIRPGHNKTQEEIINSKDNHDMANRNWGFPYLLYSPSNLNRNVVTINKGNKYTEYIQDGHEFNEVSFDIKNKTRKPRIFTIHPDNKEDINRFNNNVSYIQSGQRQKDLDSLNWDRAVAGRMGFINNKYSGWDTESLIGEYNKLTKKGKDRIIQPKEDRNPFFPGVSIGKPQPKEPITTFDRTARRDAEALGEYLITKRDMGGIEKGKVYNPKSTIDPWLGGMNFIMPDGFEPLPFDTTDRPSITGKDYATLSTGFDWKDAYKIDNIMSMGFNGLDLNYGSYDRVKKWQENEQKDQSSTEELNTGKPIITDYAAQVKAKEQERLRNVDTQGTTPPNFGTFESGGITNKHYTNKSSLQILNP